MGVIRAAHGFTVSASAKDPTTLEGLEFGRPDAPGTEPVVCGNPVALDREWISSRSCDPVECLNDQ